MNVAFDHVVHYVEAPEEAISLLEKKGIHAVEGGRHEKRGTYNFLSYFDLSYIELLSTYDKELVARTEHPPHSFLDTVVKEGFTEGFSRVALRTTNIEEAARKFRRQGLTVIGPEAFQRKRPDGSVIEWQLLYVGDQNEELELPFIIEWKESDEERRKELTERQAIRVHPSGAKLSRITFAVKDVEQTAQRWSSCLERPREEVFIDETLQAKCQAIDIDGIKLVFSSPIGEGTVFDVLRERGERPFLVTLAGREAGGTFEVCGGLYRMEEA